MFALVVRRVQCNSIHLKFIESQGEYCHWVASVDIGVASCAGSRCGAVCDHFVDVYCRSVCWPDVAGSKWAGPLFIVHTRMSRIIFYVIDVEYSMCRAREGQPSFKMMALCNFSIDLPCRQILQGWDLCPAYAVAIRFVRFGVTYVPLMSACECPASCMRFTSSRLFLDLSYRSILVGTSWNGLFANVVSFILWQESEV